MIRKAENRDFIELDYLFKKFLFEEAKYDENYNKKFKFKSLSYGLDENIIIFVFEKNNMICGFIYSSIIKRDININNIAKINFLYVSKEYRKQGIATELLKKMELELKSRNVKFIDVQAFDKNQNAINLYKNNNFLNFTTILRKKI